VHDHTLIGPLYSAALLSLPVVTTNHGPFNVELIDPRLADCRTACA
jgi:hypothetical protein